jgi:hypothetical protein
MQTINDLATAESGSTSKSSAAKTPKAPSSPKPSSTEAPYNPVIDPAKFSDKITNPLFPLLKGRTLIYDGTKDGKPEHVEMTVGKGTRKVTGVPCVIITDIVTINGALEEKTVDWYSQDADGNVWYFGEDSKDYANGAVVSTAGTWEAGVDNAKPGIIMKAVPKPGDFYRQESRPGVAEDRAKILRTDTTVKVPYGDLKRVLTTFDTDPLNPDKVENKWYAPGLGLVKADRIGSSHTEHIALTSVKNG